MIDDEAREEARRVLDFALQPENYYLLEPGGGSWQRAPGFDPRHVAKFHVGYRAVFSVTRAPDQNLYRHLTISIEGLGMPNPIATYTIAELFGFTGWDGKSEIPPYDWGLAVDKADRCIVLACLLNEKIH